MRVIVHLGQPRTGTTSLQYFLGMGNVKEVYLPIMPTVFENVPGTNHFGMSIVCLNEDRMSPPKVRFLREGKTSDDIERLRVDIKGWIKKSYEKGMADGKEVLLFSSEDLFLLNHKEEYSRLIDLFSETKARVEGVCCLRDKESFLESWSKRLDYNGYTRSDNPDDFRCINPDSSIVDYKKKTLLMMDTFDKLNMFSYNKEDNTGELLKWIGYTGVDGSTVKLNQSKGYGK